MNSKGPNFLAVFVAVAVAVAVAVDVSMSVRVCVRVRASLSANSVLGYRKVEENFGLTTFTTFSLGERLKHTSRGHFILRLHFDLHFRHDGWPRIRIGIRMRIDHPEPQAT